MPHENDINKNDSIQGGPASAPDIRDAAIPESHIRLVATPTSGLPAEHSPYYRRLVSAGYKGFLQGNIAGATLYGLLGAAVGGLSVLGISMLTAGAAPFALIPIFAGYGAIKGATTFGQIGSNAAQLAEYAEMNERRNALLDRLYETQSKDEAQEIRKLLQADTVDKSPTKLIHGRTALIGAIIGAVSLALIAYFAAPMLAETALGHAAEGLAAALKLNLSASFSPLLSGICGIVGAVAGSTIGIDRGWIRRWFDVSEGAVHERDYYEKMAQERAKEASRLHRIGQNEMQETMQTMRRNETAVLPPVANVEPPAMERVEIATNSIVSEMPTPVIANAELSEQGRLQQLQKAAAV